MGNVGRKEGGMEMITVLLNLYCEVHEIGSPYISERVPNKKKEKQLLLFFKSSCPVARFLPS